MAGRRTKPCPYCRKPAPVKDNPYRPFCSSRCQMTDLGGWASGRYRVPGEPISKSESGEAQPEKKEKE